MPNLECLVNAFFQCFMKARLVQEKKASRPGSRRSSASFGSGVFFTFFLFKMEEERFPRRATRQRSLSSQLETWSVTGSRLTDFFAAKMCLRLDLQHNHWAGHGTSISELQGAADDAAADDVAAVDDAATVDDVAGGGDVDVLDAVLEGGEEELRQSAMLMEFRSNTLVSARAAS